MSWTLELTSQFRQYFPATSSVQVRLSERTVARHQGSDLFVEDDCDWVLLASRGKKRNFDGFSKGILLALSIDRFSLMCTGTREQPAVLTERSTVVLKRVGREVLAAMTLAGLAEPFPRTRIDFHVSAPSSAPHPRTTASFRSRLMVGAPAKDQHHGPRVVLRRPPANLR